MSNHGEVNVVHIQPVYERVHENRESTKSWVQMHSLMCELDYFSLHNYNACSICSNSIHGCMSMVIDLQSLMDKGIISITRRVKISEEFHTVSMI